MNLTSSTIENPIAYFEFFYDKVNYGNFKYNAIYAIENTVGYHINHVNFENEVFGFRYQNQNTFEVVEDYYSFEKHQNYVLESEYKNSILLFHKRLRSLNTSEETSFVFLSNKSEILKIIAKIEKAEYLFFKNFHLELLNKLKDSFENIYNSKFNVNLNSQVNDTIPIDNELKLQGFIRELCIDPRFKLLYDFRDSDKLLDWIKTNKSFRIGCANNKFKSIITFFKSKKIIDCSCSSLILKSVIINKGGKILNTNDINNANFIKMSLCNKFEDSLKEVYSIFFN